MMSTNIGFEEKTYENYFILEISKTISTCFAPGQVLESHLGFDFAAYLPWWSLIFGGPRLIFNEGFGKRHQFRGVSLDEVEKLFSLAKGVLPRLKMNLFFQFKRPHYFFGARAKYISEWGGPYYSYNILAHQQAALSNLVSMSNGRAAVLYASPAFHTMNDLARFFGNKTVVINSNIANAENLDCHHQYTYNRSGVNGKGHSRPESIENKGIEGAISGGVNNEELSVLDNIKDLSSSIRKAMNASGLSSSLDIYIDSIASNLEMPGLSPSGSGAIHSAITVAAFCECFGLTYMPVGPS